MNENRAFKPVNISEKSCDQEGGRLSGFYERQPDLWPWVTWDSISDTQPVFFVATSRGVKLSIA